MDQEPATAEATIPHPMRLQDPSRTSDFTAPSLSAAAFKLDEGYADETKSQSDNECMNPPSGDAMSLPDWLLALSEADKAEFAFNLLQTLRTSTVAKVVDRLAPLLHMDPVQKLPPEITSEIFSYLDPQTLLTACLASRSWHSRILDTRLWRDLYIAEGWRVDINAIRTFEQEHSSFSSPQSRKSRSRYTDPDAGEPKNKKRVPQGWLDSRATELLREGTTAREDGLRAPIEAVNDGDHRMSDALGDQAVSWASRPSPLSPNNRRDSQSVFLPKSIGQPSLTRFRSSITVRMPNGATKLNWPHLYKLRRRLEDNWTKGRYTNFQLPHPSHPEEAHLECVYAIQFSGKWLVSGSRDRTVRVWNLETKRLWHRPLVGHTKSVLCLQFDPRPSEDVIISGSSDKNVIIWRFSTGEKIHEIEEAHSDSVLNLRFDERYLVTCSKDKLIKVWNRRELTPLDKNYPSVQEGSGVTYPSYIIDTSEIPLPILEAELARNHIRSLEPYTLLMTLDGHGAAVNAIQMNEDEIVSASGDRLIKIWNVRTGVCKKTLMGHEKGIACVQFDNRRIISGSNDDTVRIFDHASGAEVACLHGHGNLVRTVQAGFGDPPGAEEAMRLEALAIENEFWDAQRSGAPVDLGPSALRRAGHQQNTAGSRDPRDIKALGAKIPPGGGGSQWGRIVSGSYDETIIIWKKDSEGRWVIGQRLRQSDAIVNTRREALLQTAGGPMAISQAQAAMPRGNRILFPPNVTLAPTPSQTNQQNTGSQATPTQQPPTANLNSVNPMLVEPWYQLVQNPPTGATAAAAAGGGGAGAGVAANPLQPSPYQQHQMRRARMANHPGHPTSRIFKLQFDARKIICASQDPVIVGWDFVGDDEELNEACQFFTGL
ncbi:F-box and WD domain protein [Aspergillus clavatus NRRL 1]|uniref:Probable E3 ubiquitin ligase complex SCF subunit sconB n=1 Tax=Aspergillus clavatus (strain ATCC 1007 / CBS 513.65 / DSM 816 / NCTC 3887 / NRRL 1 / QM 1276 / 107) TaxID=344612 RepID=A1CI74_ASPCL|nr:F-box and WD domain protein [Aspergillus clavatus NRRL 1]EAW10579.1 F-box and WD domain protein [Aspergillus clavatus NRRL 1]